MAGRKVPRSVGDTTISASNTGIIVFQATAEACYADRHCGMFTVYAPTSDEITSNNAKLDFIGLTYNQDPNIATYTTSNSYCLYTKKGWSVLMFYLLCINEWLLIKYINMYVSICLITSHMTPCTSM